jgi:iron complex transport system ATP-binding protein
VLRQVRALATREGLAVLMTTHHPDHAFLVADAAMMLHAGTLAGPMPPADLITPERLSAAYGVEAVIGTVATPAGARQVCAPLMDWPVTRR